MIIDNQNSRIDHAALVGVSVASVAIVTILFFTVPQFTQFAQSYSPELFWSCYSVTALFIVGIPTILLLRQIGSGSSEGTETHKIPENLSLVKSEPKGS